MADRGLRRRRAEEVPVSTSSSVRSTRARSETRTVRENSGSEGSREAVTGERLGFLVFYTKRPFWV